jgi:hypothetical protein
MKKSELIKTIKNALNELMLNEAAVCDGAFGNRDCEFGQVCSGIGTGTMGTCSGSVGPSGNGPVRGKSKHPIGSSEDIPEPFKSMTLANGQTIGTMAGLTEGPKGFGLNIPLCCLWSRKCCKKAGGPTLG